jgi:ABC-type sugar transport system permease subunit
MNGRVGAIRGMVLVLAVLTVGIVALSTRLLAVNTLPIDFDEDDYLRAGQQYATGIQAGDPGVFLRDNYRTEHPPLSKIVVGLAIAPLPPAAEIPDLPTDAPPATSLPEPQLTVARTVEAVFGALAAVALALVSPLGGLFLAIHTWSIKYTSQVMLEAVPALFALASVIAYSRSIGSGGRRRRGWLTGAAVALGLACAGKYLYGVAGLAIAVDWLWRSRPEGLRRPSTFGRWVAPIGAWALVGTVAFLVADPYLWPDPVGRLSASIAYHGGYATSAHVQDAGYPSWQPLIWLMGSVPFGVDLDSFAIMVDLPITILAAIGFRRLWASHRVFALWFVIALAFLLVWPTKWPQYVLVLSSPMSLAAGHGARIAIEPVRRWLRAGARRLRRSTSPAEAAGGRAGRGRRGLQRGLRDAWIATPWLLPGLVGFAALAVIPLVYEALISLTNLSLGSLRDGISGGVLREAVGGLAGQIQAVPFDVNGSSHSVQYVGDDLLSAFARGVDLGGQTSAAFPTFSLLWMILSVGLQAVLGIAVAVVLERPGVRFPGWWRTLFILPWAIPEVVGAVAWRDIFHPEQGILAQLVGPVAWPASPELSLVVLLIAATWMGWPLWMLVATAGLRTIPGSIRDAAALDGAGPWRAFRDVTLPLLLPLLGAAFIVRGVAAFNQFYLFYVMGPSDSTMTLATYSFYVFDSTNGPGLYAVSAAVNVITLVALAGVVAWFLRWRSRAERVAFA